MSASTAKIAKKGATKQPRAPSATTAAQATVKGAKKAKPSAQSKVKKHAAAKAAVADRAVKKLTVRPAIAQTHEIKNVRRMVSLGDGLYVIDTTLGEDYSQLGLPTIPVSRVRAAFARHEKRAGHFVGQVTEKRLEDDDNARFMSNLKGQASISRQTHIDDGTLINSSELWNRLGITRQSGSKAINEYRIFSLDGPGGKALCPAFFADSKYDRSTLERVSKELGAIPGPSKWQFFTTPKLSLDGKTPLEAIEKGRIEEVLSAAIGFREQ